MGQEDSGNGHDDDDNGDNGALEHELLDARLSVHLGRGTARNRGGIGGARMIHGRGDEGRRHDVRVLHQWRTVVGLLLLLLLLRLQQRQRLVVLMAVVVVAVEATERVATMRRGRRRRGARAGRARGTTPGSGIGSRGWRRGRRRRRRAVSIDDELGLAAALGRAHDLARIDEQTDGAEEHEARREVAHAGVLGGRKNQLVDEVVLAVDQDRTEGRAAHGLVLVPVAGELGEQATLQLELELAHLLLGEVREATKVIGDPQRRGLGFKYHGNARGRRRRKNGWNGGRAGGRRREEGGEARRARREWRRAAGAERERRPRGSRAVITRNVARICGWCSSYTRQIGGHFRRRGMLLILLSAPARYLPVASSRIPSSRSLSGTFVLTTQGSGVFVRQCGDATASTSTADEEETNQERMHSNGSLPRARYHGIALPAQQASHASLITISPPPTASHLRPRFTLRPRPASTTTTANVMTEDGVRVKISILPTVPGACSSAFSSSVPPPRIDPYPCNVVPGRASSCSLAASTVLSRARAARGRPPSSRSSAPTTREEVLSSQPTARHDGLRCDPHRASWPRSRRHHRQCLSRQRLVWLAVILSLKHAHTRTRYQEREISMLQSRDINQSINNQLMIDDWWLAVCVHTCWERSGWSCAVKSLSSEMSTESEIMSFKKEIELMQSLPPHPNILTCACSSCSSCSCSRS